MSIIGVDVDGVLANFEAGFTKVLTHVSGIQFSKLGQPDWPSCWDWDLEAGITKTQQTAAWNIVKADQMFWLDLPTHPGASAFLQWLSSRHIDDIYFITNRMGKKAKWQTERWLKRHGFFGSPTVLITSEKGACCKALNVNFYVDDKNENITDVMTISPATQAFMIEQPYNKPSGCQRGNLLGFMTLIERGK